MAENQNDDRLLKWLRGELSEEELRETLPADEVTKYKQILAEIDQWKPVDEPFTFDESRLSAAAPRQKIRTLSWWMPYSVAAAILLLIIASLWILLSPSEFAYTNTTAAVQKIVLPDEASAVSLAPGAEVRWREADWNDGIRKVWVNGTALFEVEKGGPFEVIANQGKVEVLGTTFEVRAYQTGMLVACYEGRVRASAADGSSVILAAGEGQLLYEGVWEGKSAVAGNLPGWLQGETAFIKAPLRQVIESLEKLYDITIVPGKVNMERRFTGSVPHDKLDLALKIVFDPLGISYELKEDKLYLAE